MKRRTTRRWVWAGIAVPVLLVPPTLLAQASPHPDPHGWIDSALKWWGVLSVVAVAGMQLWIRSIVREQIDQLREATGKALTMHDTNPDAHANHKNPPKYAAEIAEVRSALGRVEMQTAVILARIEAGQERNAEHWESLTGRLDHLASIETRVIAIESSCAIHQDRKGR